MGRNIGYDLNEVLDSAAVLFREKGFAGTSVQDLVNATGINRFAIYEKFGGKEDLFYATLDFYVEVPVKAKLLACLRGPEVNLDSLMTVLQRMREVNLDASQPAGCLIINASIEMAGRDPRVEQVVDEFSDAFRTAALHVLRLSEARGELTDQKSAGQRAEYLVTMINAFMVVAHMSRPSADKLMIVLMDDVESWRRMRVPVLKTSMG